MRAINTYKRLSAKCLVFILPMVICLSGCIKDKDEDCPQGLYLVFSAINPKHDLKKIIKTVDIYLYTPDDKLFRQYRYQHTELRPSDYAALIPYLPYGEYKAVAVINQTDYFEALQTDSYSTLHTDLIRLPDGNPLPMLFSGECVFSYDLRNLDRPAIPVPLFKHNNHIRLEIITSPDATLLEPPVATIQARNSSFRYASYSCENDQSVSYLPEWYEENTQENHYQFLITTLRIWQKGDIKLQLNLTEDKVIILDLPVELAKIKNDQGEYLYDSDEKLEFEDEYNIRIVLDQNHLVLRLSINGWDIIRGNIEV